MDEIILILLLLGNSGADYQTLKSKGVVKDYVSIFSYSSSSPNGTSSDTAQNQYKQHQQYETCSDLLSKTIYFRKKGNVYNSSKNFSLFTQLQSIKTSFFLLELVDKIKIKKSISGQISTAYEPCQCSISIVLPFYPCGIKYCEQPEKPFQGDEGGGDRSNDSNHETKMVRIRCGITTCRRQFTFMLTVPDKFACLSNFNPNNNLNNRIYSNATMTTISTKVN